MTDANIIIAISKLAEDVVLYDEIRDFYFKVTSSGKTVVPKPKYDESHDAIIPVIEKQSDQVKMAFGEALANTLGYYDDYYEGWAISGNSITEFIVATPKQLCIALLKVTGNEKERSER